MTAARPPAKRASKKAPAKKAAPRRRPTKADLEQRRLEAEEVARLERLARARDVLELRRGGIGFDKIAVHPEVLPAGVTQLPREEVLDLYQLALEETIPQPADQVRRLELDRLERLIPRLYTKALNGDAAAAREVVKISKLRVEIAGKRGPLDDDRVVGPCEAETAKELADLKVRDSMGLSAGALILARCVDDAGSESSAANAHRELRMTLMALRALHGAGDGGSGKPLVDPDAPPAEGTVVPQSRLAELRKRGAGRVGG